jgi:hypothetical protein
MKKIITITAAFYLTLLTYAEPCYELEPIGYCAPTDQAPLPGGPPSGNYCVEKIYHPHGYAVQCLDVSSVEGEGGYKICIPNSVTVYMDYIWYHEVNGHCVDDDQTFRIDNLMVGSCQQDYIPMMAAPCP